MSPTASARKSQGEYKPIIKFADGRTRVVEQAPEKLVHTPYGTYKGPGFYKRGNTYATREEAITAAQAAIDANREDAEARLAKCRANGFPEERLAPFHKEIAFWGGEA